MKPKDTAEAMMAVAVLAVRSDGAIDEEEAARLSALCRINPLFEGVADPPSYVREVSRKAAAAGVDATLDAVVTVLPRHLRESAYAWALEIVHADESAIAEEGEFLYKLRHRFDLDNQVTDGIHAVMKILKRR